MDQELNEEFKPLTFRIKLCFMTLDIAVTSKAQAKKEKIDKLNLIKIKNFYASKNIKWEKIFVSHILDNGQYPKYSKNLYNLNQSIKKKWAEELNRYFSKENKPKWPVAT